MTNHSPLLRTMRLQRVQSLTIMIHRAEIAVALLFTAVLVFAKVSFGQPPAVANKTPAAHEFIDTQECLDCHTNKIKRSDFLGDTAAVAWNEYDKHRDAFRILKKEKALVHRILGFDLAEAFSDEKLTTFTGERDAQPKVRIVRQCLNCHATWPHDREGDRPPVPLDSGVSCQACHGAGFDWDQPHRSEWWRLVTPAAKESLGFKNVRDPAERMRICTSCHVGNYAEGKFVTHAWYASGHPPLPSFEFSTFAAAMPVHWRPLREKTEFRGKEANSPPPDSSVDTLATFLRKHTKVPPGEVRSSYREANFPPEQFRDSDPFMALPRLQDTVISGAVVLETYAKLVKEYAAAANEGGNQARAAWPEFAIYDCASCHHELRSGKGFPQRPFGKHPLGRPPAQVWPLALAKLGVWQSVQFDPPKAAERLAQLAAAQTDFERALTGSSSETKGPVFGRPSEVQASAEKLAAELTKLIASLKSSRYDTASARSALLFLTDASQVEIHDYHSARQIAWSIREITKDLRGMPHRRTAENAAAFLSAEQLFDVRPNPSEPAVDLLVLKLPSTQQQSIVGQLHETLPAIGNYDSALFAERLQFLHSKLQPVPAP